LKVPPTAVGGISDFLCKASGGGQYSVIGSQCLISSGVDAQRRPRKLHAQPLAEAAEWIEGYRQFWEANFQRLDNLLDQMKAEKKRKSRVSRKR